MRPSLTIWLAAVFVLSASIAGGAYYVSQRIGPGARNRVIQLLADRFDADVELKSLEVFLVPTPRVIGEGLTLRHKGWNSAHPLIVIQRFTAETDLTSLLGIVKSVSLVRLEGLEIHLSGGMKQAMKQSMGTAAKSAKPDKNGNSFPFVIQSIVADGTLLEIEPKVEGKQPLDFRIEKLRLRSVGPRRAMVFQAELTNAKPPGLIESTGTFGPWQKEDPRTTPLGGKYTFRNADLSVFKGISGILSSDGQYQGVLDRIEAQGTTDTPNFAVKTGSNSVDLKTSFHAIIDGTDGDTYLQPVDARFLNTELECRGQVAGTRGQKGKTVSLQVNTIHARIEDLLRLTVKAGKPLLVGDASFRTKFVLPPGDREVMDKLMLDGDVSIASAKFTNFDIQHKLLILSRRSQGETKGPGDDQDSVASDFKGRFHLNNGLAALSGLNFSVPGAGVSLDGTYGLKSGDIDMHGVFRMQAKLSQTQTGWKALLLKAVDPFFERDGSGTYVPIKIGGNRSHPSFGLDFHRKDRNDHR